MSRGLAQVKALHHFGKYADAVALARGLRSAVDALDHGELSARFFLESSIAHRANRTIDEAEEDGYRAVSLADAAGDDVLRAKAWTNLLIVVGYFRSDEKQGARIYDQAMGVLTRTAGDPMLEADLRAAHAVVLSGRHKHAEMSAEGEKAVAVYERGPSSLSLADALRNLCIAESRLGRVDAARRHCEKALTVMREVAGDAHPMVGRILSNLASALLQARETDLALAAASRAVAIYEGASDTEGANIDFAVALMVLGETLLELERFGEALPVLERCLPLVDRKGAWQQVSFRVRTGLGQAHLGLEQPERAVPHLERVVTVSDVDAEYLADARFHLARALVSLSRDHERAMRLVEEAKALLAGKPALSPLQRKKGDAMQRWASARHAPAAHPSQTPSSVSRTAPAGMR